MDDLYLVSTVVTRRGKEDAFVALMREVTAAAAALGGAGSGFILRDVEEPNRFIVVRRFDSQEAMERWFQSPESKGLWESADELVESYEGMTGTAVFDIAPSSGSPEL